MPKRKQSGFDASFQNQLLELTKDTPLLLCGTVLNRQKLRGSSQKGEWEMFQVEVRGVDGRVAKATVTNPQGVPPVGEFIALPVFVGSNGFLREARDLNAETF